MMKTWMAICCCWPFFGLCQVKADKNYFEDLLARKQYKRVFLEGTDLLKKPYGKTSPLTYYYIGRSLCGSGYTNQGKGWFKYIKAKFPIDRDFVNELDMAEVNCSTNTSFAPPKTTIIIVNASYAPTMPGGIRGKSGFTLNCRRDANENYDKLRNNDSLDRRLFFRNEKAAAVKNLRSFLPAEYSIDTSGRFIVVSLASNAYFHEDIVKVTNKLEYAYRFYITKYKLRESDKLLTVYLLPDRYTLRKTATIIHDISISNANIGYSSLNDLSLLGLAKPNSVGTLFHELFHLVIRSEIGDISPWLDEGMACLYSVYGIQNNELMGSYDTWRVMHFKLLMNLKSNGRIAVPTLEQLLNYNWNEFEGGSSNNLCEASVHYALSNLFVLYLQYKGKLPAVVEKFRNRRQYSTDTLSTGPDDIQLMEWVFETKIENLSAGFYAWLKDRYNIDMPALLTQRRSYSSLNLPENVKPAFDTISLLLTEIENTPKLIKKKALKDLNDERWELFYAIERSHKYFIREQEEKLRDLADRDMDDAIANDGQNNNEGVKLAEGRLLAFTNKLRGILKGPSSN